MKILLTTHQFLPDYTSGTEVLTFEVARELERVGHEVNILTGWPTESRVEPLRAYDTYRYEGIKVHRIHAPSTSATTVAERTRTEFDNPAAAAAFTALTANWRPDVVHFFHLHRLSCSVALRCAQQGIASVYTATDFWSICPLNQLRLPDGATCSGPDDDSANCVLHLAVHGRRAHLSHLYRWVPTSLVGAVLRIAPADEQSASQNLGAARALQHRPETMRRMLNTVDRIVAPTSVMASKLVEFGAPAASVVELEYGIDTTLYKHRSPLRPTPTLRIGFVGTLHGHKGADVLIDAVRLLDPSVDCAVRIYGDESFYPDYVAQIRASAADEPRISFCGTFKRTELPRVMNTFDVLVVPSTWTENTPLVIFAAQAAGRPVVGSNVAGIASVVNDGVNGLLFDAGDTAALAAIIERLVDDPEGLLALAERARPAKDISHYVADLLDIYDEVLAKHAHDIAAPMRIPA